MNYRQKHNSGIVPMIIGFLCLFNQGWSQNTNQFFKENEITNNAAKMKVIEKIEKAFVTNNIHELKELAHSLKGAARSACCPHLGQIASDIQDKTERSQILDTDLIASLRSEFDRATAEIRALKI